MPPQVTVIIPTYNRARMLGDAIESVRSQTFQDIEIIVADDGSTDETETVLSRASPPPRHLRLEHSGRPGFARNAALAHARGETIAFLDDDDLWRPDKLELQVNLLSRFTDVGFVYSDIRFFQDAEQVGPPVLSEGQKQHGSLYDTLLNDCFIYPSSLLIRRELLQQIGGFDPQLTICEDYDLLLRIARLSPAAYIDDTLTYIRRHPANISKLRQPEIYANTVDILEAVRRRDALSFQQRMRIRRSLAAMRRKLANLLHLDGRIRQARREIIRSLCAWPLQAQAWNDIIKSLLDERHR